MGGTVGGYRLRRRSHGPGNRQIAPGHQRSPQRTQHSSQTSWRPACCVRDLGIRCQRQCAPRPSKNSVQVCRPAGAVPGCPLRSKSQKEKTKQRKREPIPSDNKQRTNDKKEKTDENEIR